MNSTSLHRQSASLLLAALALVLWSQLPALAQQVVQSRGIDSRLDYASLQRFGPWDDRNYRLTAEDVALLPPEDAEATVAVPAFFRIEIRRSLAAQGKTLLRYPRSSFPRFMARYGGYLVDRRLYRSYRRTPAGFEVVLDSESETPLEFLAARGGATEARVTSPNDAAESAIAISPTSPLRVIAGTNGPGAGQVMHYSADGGASWSSAGSLSGSCCDPTVGWSTDGTKSYTATLPNAGSVGFYASSDNGQTWGSMRNIDSGFVDKEYLHVDSFATSPYKDSIYLTWHLGNEMRFARSTDFGDTWSAVTAFSTAPSGIGSDITTDKAGNIYYIYPGFTSKIVLLKSTDGGQNFAADSLITNTQGNFEFPLPAMETRRVFIYVSADTDLSNGPFANSVYASWTDSTAPTGAIAANNHGRIQVAYSRDGGTTWNFSTPHSTSDQSTVDRFHQWLKVGADGSVHIVYYDTGFDGDRTSVDFYYAVSTDGAATWSTPERLTTVTSANISDGFEWGDYNGLDVVLSDLIAIYTDNRNESGPAGDSVDVYAIRKAVAAGTQIFADGFETGDTTSWN